MDIKWGMSHLGVGFDVILWRSSGRYPILVRVSTPHYGYRVGRSHLGVGFVIVLWISSKRDPLSVQVLASTPRGGEWCTTNLMINNVKFKNLNQHT